MLTKEQLAEYEKQYPEMEHVKGPPKKGSESEPQWEIVLKRPGRANYKRFKAKLHEGPLQKSEAMETLVKAALAYPSPEAFEALLETHYGICESKGVNVAIDRLCSMSSSDEAKS
jgi:hypothetical protein